MIDVSTQTDAELIEVVNEVDTQLTLRKGELDALHGPKWPDSAFAEHAEWRNRACYVKRLAQRELTRRKQERREAAKDAPQRTGLAIVASILAAESVAFEGHSVEDAVENAIPLAKAIMDEVMAQLGKENG